jgi:peptide/nickel transport system substrate-binding protein
MLRQSAPDLTLSSSIKEWVASEQAVDPLTVRIRLNKPGPRWVRDVLATGQTTRFVVVPKHIWEGREARSFGFFDLAQNWPVGTGPYRIVRSDSGAIVFDRLDQWWAVGAGLAQALPAPERIIYRPATAEAWPQLFTNNDIDTGHAIPVGALEAAKARNPKISSWNTTGPVWGTSAGCTLRLAYNVQAAPFDSVEIRQAVAAMVDRQQIVDLAYEGSAPPAAAPFASFDGVKAYTKQLQDILPAPTAKPDKAKAEALLTGKGYKRGPDGKWRQPDGTPWTLTILTQASDPIGPVLARQLQNAGVDAVFRPTQDTAYFDALTSGNYALATATHCGSLYDPWQTLEHFHSKYSGAPGTRIANVRAITRYANPEMDKILNQMEAMQPQPTDPAYLALVRQAITILFRDMPQVTLAEEFHPITWNNTYWTGWPAAQNAYVAPFQAWEGFALIIHRLKPAQ